MPASEYTMENTFHLFETGNNATPAIIKLLTIEKAKNPSVDQKNLTDLCDRLINYLRVRLQHQPDTKNETANIITKNP